MIGVFAPDINVEIKWFTFVVIVESVQNSPMSVILPEYPSCLSNWTSSDILIDTMTFLPGRRSCGKEVPIGFRMITFRSSSPFLGNRKAGTDEKVTLVLPLF